ncbi:MAG: tail fiber domain-containing protein [Verrucomicrobia bacterium]|nr:tail fiber domain-containing protein [Verrucomicrobiota bacterium]
MKIAQAGVGAILSTLLFAGTVRAQNVGIGVSNPESKLTVNGNLAIGTDYNTVAPTNGAVIEGFLGIGTKTPVAPLHVATSTLVGVNGSYSWFDAISTALTQGTVSGSDNISAAFSAKVYANTFTGYGGSYIAGSDARLKNIIGRSDSAMDLATLNKIEITDYTMKDTATYGNRPVKKVIAQQVAQVYPSAVKSIGLKGVTFTPDIYVLAQPVKSEKPDVYTISLTKAHSLKDGDSVRLITPKNLELTVTVQVLDAKTFSFASKDPLDDKVFVYGKECTDLQGVDYDAISMLNVSATQELAKQVDELKRENSDLQDQAKRLSAVEEKEKTAQQAKIAELEAKVASLEATNAKVSAMTTEMESLKQALATVQEKESHRVRPIALEE